MVVAASPATHYLQRAHGDNNDTEEPQALPVEQQALLHGGVILQEDPTRNQAWVSSRYAYLFGG